MPCYLFHVFNHDRTVDAQGKVLADLDAARAVAVEGARSIMADELRTKGRIDLSDWIEIEDENGDMTVVKFGDAVKVEAREIVDLLTRNAAKLESSGVRASAQTLRESKLLNWRQTWLAWKSLSGQKKVAEQVRSQLNTGSSLRPQRERRWLPYFGRSRALS